MLRLEGGELVQDLRSVCVCVISSKYRELSSELYF
jgi:hypothetical protein